MAGIYFSLIESFMVRGAAGCNGLSCAYFCQKARLEQVRDYGPYCRIFRAITLIMEQLRANCTLTTE
ncbi:hypothetical protein C162_29665 [Paenibacillus sp. FSL R7-269]|nr:hypothetical protein C162_29665 [Paenibacillus sp. FSL R7-269]